MYLVSTAKSTVLTEFNDLQTRSVYQHANGEATDFQFCTQQRIFVEVNKKSGLEIMRIKEQTDQKVEIQRVRKLSIDNVYCVACAKQCVEEIAVGLANGHVRLYNYKNSEFIQKFSGGSRDSVVYLDYSLSDEYIAAVYENGFINVYSKKTKIQSDKINIDGHSTLARFHPLKRFQLAVASFKGAVTLYDIQAKRKLFNATDAHAAPCRDLFISSSAPDTLLTVGYDCLINIFDIRRKGKPIQLSYCHPLSTIAASECGTYFCVGNLKGELTTYDMRNLDSILNSRKVHDCSVNRVAFIPSGNDNSAFSLKSISTTINQTTPSGHETSIPFQSIAASDNSNLLAPTNNYKDGDKTREHRDSFCDFLDFQANRGQEKSSPRFAPRRDSFDWEALSRKQVQENRISLVPSDDVLNYVYSMKHNDSADTKLQSVIFDTQKLPLKDRSNIVHQTSLLVSKLEKIKEEDKPKIDIVVEEISDINMKNDKENAEIELHLVNARLRSLPDETDNRSPPRNRHSMDDILDSEKPRSTSTTNNTPAVKQKSNSALQHAFADTNVCEAIANLRQEMLAHFRRLEFEMKFSIENMKWQIFTQNSNLWNKQLDLSTEIRDSLAILLQTDPFVNEFLRLKQENDLLKEQIQQFIQK